MHAQPAQVLSLAIARSVMRRHVPPQAWSIAMSMIGNLRCPSCNQPLIDGSARLEFRGIIPLKSRLFNNATLWRSRAGH
jgi:hypothetical protein